MGQQQYATNKVFVPFSRSFNFILALHCPSSTFIANLPARGRTSSKAGGEGTNRNPRNEQALDGQRWRLRHWRRRFLSLSLSIFLVHMANVSRPSFTLCCRAKTSTCGRTSSEVGDGEANEDLRTSKQHGGRR